MMQSNRPRSSQFAAGTSLHLWRRRSQIGPRPVPEVGRPGSEAADNERMDAAFHGGAVGRMDRRRQAQEFKIGLSAEPSAMDPHFHNLAPNTSMTKHIFDRLLDQDEKQQIKPRLAPSWSTLDDTTWEFKLRPGVKFTDGSDFTANDVIYSFAACRRWRTRLPPWRSTCAPSPA